MTQEHPVHPSRNLIQQWLGDYFGCPVSGELSDSELYLATQAARWGADEELQACINWLYENDWKTVYKHLRDARRPKPPSLKEQALEELKDWTDEKHGPGGEVFLCEGLSVALIRRALESLPD